MTSAIIMPSAWRDVRSAVRWIARDNPVAADGLREAVIAAAQRIGTHPQIGVKRPDVVDGPFRFVTISGYPYVVVNNPDLSPPAILRVLHGARDLPTILHRP